MRLAASQIAVLILAGLTFGQGDLPELPPGDSPPPTVFSRIADAGDADSYDSAAYVIVVDSAVTSITEDGVAKTENYLLRKILTEEGCRQLAVLDWGYEPLSSYVDIREVNLIRDKKSIPVDIKTIKDLPAPQSMIYWSNRIKVIQLPKLRVGDGIEVKYFRKGYSYALLQDNSEPPDSRYIPPMHGEYFDIIVFESTSPIIEKKYVLKMPSEKRIHSQIYNGPMYSSTTYSGDTTIYAWWNKDVSAWEPQNYAPDDTDILTKVVIATVESWEAKSRWFFEINNPQFAFTPAIKAKVDEIFKKAGVTKGTEEQKAFELVHWVAQNIRYSGQTMGEGEGYTLHPGAMIFEQRSGVCKDIAGMLITMMRAAGMDSYGAMTMAGSRIEREVPADQFNHCVVALHKKDGRYVMYDPTWVPYNEDIWSKYETEQQFLIGTPAGHDLGQIPYSPPEESPLNADNQCRILKDGTLEGTLTLTSDGTMDGRLRGYIYYRQLSELNNTLASIFHHLGDQAEITSFQHGDIQDFHKSMWWKISYRVPDYALFADNGYDFASPLMTMADKSLYRYMSVDWPEKRRDDVFFYTTSFFNGSESIKLPDGYKVEKLPDKSELNETYASFAGDSQMKKGNLEISQQLKIKRRQIPPKGYDGFRKVMKEADNYAGSEFRAVTGGAK